MPQPSVPVVNPHDYVTCAKHNARRLARFCTPCPVYNADHEIIDYVFECRENQLCSSAQRQASSSHGAHVGGRADTQEGAFGRRGAHEGDTGEGMNTESAPAQPMVFDASSSSNSNTTGAHSNARYMAGGMQGNRNDTQQQQQQTGTTLFSVSFTAPSEAKEVRNAELGKSTTTTTTTDETKTGQEDSSAHNATAKEAAATQERAESSAMGQTTAATTTMSAQDKEGTHEEEKEQLCGNNNNNNEEGTRPTHTTAGTVVAVVVAGGVEVTGGMSERPATASSPTQFTSPRAPLRYYDMLQRAGNAPHGGAHANSIGGGFGHGGAMASMPKKVCWYCGLTGHEKQECTNTLCRSCHARRPGNPHSSSGSSSMPAYHTCVPVRDVSPFIVVPRLLPQGRDAMPAVRCVSCGAYGHFDCSATAAALGAASPPSSSASSQVRANNAEGQDHNNNNSAAAVVTKGTLNCCFCGGRGHTAFDCYERKRMNPDRWEQRVLALAGEPENNESRYNNNYGSYSAGNASYRQGGRGNAEFERRSYYQSGTGSNYSQPYTSSRGGNTSNSRNYNYEDTYNRQDASSIAAQTTRYTSPAAPYNTPYHQARSETNYAGREAPAPPPPSTTAAASSSSSRRRPREVYENEYSAQTRGGYAYNTGSTVTGTNDERGTLRAYREERTGTSPAAALREYDTTLTTTTTNNDNNSSSNAVRREERHRSTSGSHHSHHSHHRHHRSERGEDYEDRHENEGTRETSSRRARHDSRRRGPNNTNKDNGVGDEEEDYTPRSARRGNVSGDEVNYAGRTRRHEEGNYGRYNTTNNNNSEGMARNASHQQQQQQSSYNAYTHGGNAGRAERNNFTRDDRTYNTTSLYHHHQQQQQQTSQPRYTSPSYRDKRGGSNTTNNITTNSYNARAEEMPYGRHANEARQYGYSQPQRWRSEANASRYAPQSRTGQYQRGGRNNNNNNSNRYNDDESDLY